MTEESTLLPEAPDEGEESPFMLRHRIDPRAVALIKANNPGLSEADLGRFLEVAAGLGLNPLVGEIYCSRGKGKDGRPGRLLFMVGRDGLLKIADRHPDFEGFEGDVVYSEDVFTVEWREGKQVVQHSYNFSSPRGEIVGAWARVYRRGRKPTFFYAPRSEYEPKDITYDSPWKRQLSIMLHKVPLSVCLRLAFTLSGVVGEDEGARALDPVDELPTPLALEAGTSWRDELPVEVLERLSAAQQTAGPMVDDAVLEMACAGQSLEKVIEFIETIEAENAAIAEAEVVETTSGDAHEPASEVSGTEPVEAVAPPVEVATQPATASTEVERYERRIARLEKRLEEDDLPLADESLAAEEIEFLQSEIARIKTEEEVA